MRHCDADALTLSALGEPTLDAADVEHLLGCQRCSEDLRSSRRTVVTARGPREDVAVEPPPEVWAAVVAELGLQIGTTSPPAPATVRPAGPSREQRPPRRRVARVLSVAAGALVIALAAGATGAALADRDDVPDPAERDEVVAAPGPEIAQARLEPLPDGGEASGTALLVGRPADRSLQVRVSGLPDSSGYYEVWLIDPVSGAMVSLGVIGTTTRPAVLQVPAGIDIGTYSLVDVSDEPLDGNPTHSRVSVARGELA